MICTCRTCGKNYENNNSYKTSICDDCHKKVFVGQDCVINRRVLSVTPWEVHIK